MRWYAAEVVTTAPHPTRSPAAPSRPWDIDAALLSELAGIAEARGVALAELVVTMLRDHLPDAVAERIREDFRRLSG